MPVTPIPRFKGVREVFTDSESAVLIAPDDMAGRKHVYSVIRIMWTGETRCIGRELDLKIARAVARRPASEDGKSLI